MSLAALVTYDCASEVDALTKVGPYSQCVQGVDAALQKALTTVAPWSLMAQGQRLCEQAAMLLSRHSSEDLLYAVFFMIHGLGICELDLVKHTVNPTWEKGPVRNAAEFATMCTKCAGPFRYFARTSGLHSASQGRVCSPSASRFSYRQTRYCRR